MPRSLRWISAASLGLALAAAPAAAQIEAGDKSVGVQGMFATLTGVEDVSFTFGMGFFSFNKFQTSKFAWRFNLSTQISSGEDEFGESTTDVSTGIGGGLEWNFNKAGQKTIPFVGLDVTMFTGQDETFTMLSPSAGFRSFVSRSTSFDVALSYNTIVSGGEDTGGAGIILGRLGFSYYLGKDPRR